MSFRDADRWNLLSSDRAMLDSRHYAKLSWSAACYTFIFNRVALSCVCYYVILAFVNLDLIVRKMSLNARRWLITRGALFLCQSCNLYVKIQLPTQTFN